MRGAPPPPGPRVAGFSPSIAAIHSVVLDNKVSAATHVERVADCRLERGQIGRDSKLIKTPRCVLELKISY